ncbi:MAG: Stp1/IreP family PP2C-type Ser/Thr phosphatase [Candidatus Acidiferrales bacterium]
MIFGASSEAGRIRKNNEDSFAVSREMNLFVVSDGMGGQASGEIASRLAVETVLAHCFESSSNSTYPFVGERIAGISETSNRLASGIRSANQAILQTARASAAQRGMGATIVAVRCEGERMSVAHVGDSRAYRFRGNELEQLTRDHSLVAEQVRYGELTEAEGSTSELQNVLLRGLGIDSEVEVDVTDELLVEGDLILLCTDGLTHEVPDTQIASILRDAPDPQEAANHLVNAANQAGGRDNITAIVLRPFSQRIRAGRLGKWLRSLGDQS